MTVEKFGVHWFKSQQSGDGEACVEVAWLEAGRVGVRDSKDPAGPSLIFTPRQWDAFTACVTDRGFDLRSDL